mmetsp:Transcript_46721/g.150035  ORF Transcript_46721/g.150035 Transcript_46721/m.150035 type:complete len:214 (-) Transcript_46721:2452-3093(-)
MRTPTTVPTSPKYPRRVLSSAPQGRFFTKTALGPWTSAAGAAGSLRFLAAGDATASPPACPAAAWSMASETTASSPRGSSALRAPMPLARRARMALCMSMLPPVSRCTLRAGCRASSLCISLAFSRDPATTRDERLSIFSSKAGRAASMPATGPSRWIPSTRLSARRTASLRAWLAPCALNGVIGCAASPITVTRREGAAALRRMRGSSGWRS